MTLLILSFPLSPLYFILYPFPWGRVMAIVSNYMSAMSAGVARLEPNALTAVIAKTAVIALGVGLITHSFVLSVVAGFISFSCLVFAETPPVPPPRMYQAAPAQVQRAEAQLADLGTMDLEQALAFLGRHRKETVKEMNKYLRDIRKVDAYTADQIEEALREIRREIDNPLVPKEMRKFIKGLSTEGFFARTVRRVKYAVDK